MSRSRPSRLMKDHTECSYVTFPQQTPTTKSYTSKLSLETSNINNTASTQHTLANLYSMIWDEILTHYYRIDPKLRIVYPGIPPSAANLHDYFNLIVLIPVVIVLGLNWDFATLRDSVFNRKSNYSLKDAWIGEYEAHIFNLALFYFVVDLIWVAIIPRCVRSPITIISHHLACMVYLYLVHLYPEQFWFMGMCLSIEINTWFLIARRVANKQGFSVWTLSGLPFGLSVRLKVISACFYLTWFIGRCLLFPYLLTVVLQEWFESKHFSLLLKLCMHSLFTYLNLKWTYDLVISKINYIKKLDQGGRSDESQNDKGL